MKIGIIPGATFPFSDKLIFSPYAMMNIAYLLTEELVRRGHEVVVFATVDSKTSAKIAPGWEFPSSYFKKCKNGKQRQKNLEKYYQNIISLSSQFDILQLHEFIGSVRALKALKCPLIITLHAPRLLKRDKKLIKDKFIVAISKNQKRLNSHIAKFQGVVYNGIPVELYKFNKKPKDYLFFIGRISSEKGVWEAIKVAKIVKKKLLIAGPLPVKKNLSKKEKKYLQKVLKEIKKSKNIKYLGVITGKKKLNYLKNTYCLLFPTRYEEPFGLVMTESMACGTPVIAFNRGAAPEIIKDGQTGFIVKNVIEMAEAVKKISQISRKKCRQWVEKNFTVKKMVDGYEKIYKKVIGKK